MTTYYQERKPHRNMPNRAHREDEEEILEEEWPTRLPTRTRRYDSISQTPTQSAKHIKVVEYYHDQPLKLRASRTQEQKPHQQAYSIHPDAFETQILHDKRLKRGIHPLLYLGVGMLFMLALFLLLTSARTWIQQKE